MEGICHGVLGLVTMNILLLISILLFLFLFLLYHLLMCASTASASNDVLLSVGDPFTILLMRMSFWVLESFISTRVGNILLQGICYVLVGWVDLAVRSCSDVVMDAVLVRLLEGALRAPV